MIYKPKCYVVGILLFMSIFFGCDDSKKQSSHTQDLRLGQEKWLFSTQYIKAIFEYANFYDFIKDNLCNSVRYKMLDSINQYTIKHL